MGNRQQTTTERQERSLTPTMNFRPALLILFLATICNAYDSQCGGSKDIWRQRMFNNQPCSYTGRDGYRQTGTCHGGLCFKISGKKRRFGQAWTNDSMI